MSHRIDIIGEQFERWTVRSYAGQNYWNCECECGTRRQVYGFSLRSGRSTGCLKCKRPARITHAGRRTRLYTIWSRMRGRCLNPNDKAYDRYGGAGVRIFRAWRRFEVFRDWALANGYSTTLTIDRYPNKRGNYSPSNCRWATYTQQNRNRLNNKPIRYYGRLVLIPELAERYGLPADIVKNRIRRYGWSVRRALKTPVALREKHEPWLAVGMSRSSWYRHQANIDTMKEAA